MLKKQQAFKNQLITLFSAGTKKYLLCERIALKL